LPHVFGPRTLPSVLGIPVALFPHWNLNGVWRFTEVPIITKETVTFFRGALKFDNQMKATVRLQIRPDVVHNRRFQLVKCYLAIGNEFIRRRKAGN
jgi:hypothetical protein